MEDPKAAPRDVANASTPARGSDLVQHTACAFVSAHCVCLCVRPPHMLVCPCTACAFVYIHCVCLCVRLPRVLLCLHTACAFVFAHCVCFCFRPLRVLVPVRCHSQSHPSHVRLRSSACGSSPGPSCPSHKRHWFFVTHHTCARTHLGDPRQREDGLCVGFLAGAAHGVEECAGADHVE